MAEPVGNAPEVEEEVSVEEEESEEAGNDRAPNSKQIAAQLMRNPQVLAALQDKMGSLIGTNSGYIESLPKPVKRRIKALKKLQNEAFDIESQFFQEVHELECKYAAQYAPLYEKRSEILTGKTEPNDEECEWPSDDEDDEEKKEADGQEDKAAKEEEEKKGEDTKGIPCFWLTIFKNVDMLADMVQDDDEPILEHLQDVKVKFSDAEPKGFTLEFHFAPNDFFTETLLTKQYTMRFAQDESDPLSYEGPEIVKCAGCPITWNKGKNVTVQVVKKKQKHKGKGTTRTVTKTVKKDSFFNFFSPPEVPEEENEDDLDEETETLLATDFEVGHFIRERVVPRAVLYFTGEALEQDDDYDEDEGEEEDDGDYDEENDPDFVPNEGEKPPECKQQ